MRLLMLYGVNCNKTVWDSMKPFLQQHDIDYVEYPHEIIGHSLGGIIALQLATEYKMRPKKIVYLDTNLKPAKAFYRNLMTSEHMEQFGESVIHMFQEEREFYTAELFDSLQKEFDYSGYVNQLGQKVYAVYGDRNQPYIMHAI